MHQSAALYLTKATMCFALAGLATGASGQQSQCSIASGPTITPVIELYTSEGCSSCPPADQWASTLKGGSAVVQAFHVGYWDYIGWVDRFAAPAYTQRQRGVAAKNQLRSIYTPQVVLDGKDWPRWRGKPSSAEPAKFHIFLKQSGHDQFEASVTHVNSLTPTSSSTSSSSTQWSAYWTVTEHGHHSRVLSGENKGEYLKHDFVVRQLVQAGDYNPGDTTAQKLNFRSIAPTPGHQRQINLVVFDSKSGKTMQAVTLQCNI